MTTSEVRCAAPHPRHRTRLCNAKLFDCIAETVVVVWPVRLDAIGAGCSVHTCPRCGATYVIAPRPIARELAG